MTVTFTKVRGVEDGGKSYVLFDGTTSTRYIADNKGIIEGYSMRDYTLDQVKTRFPNIDTAKPLAIQSDITFQYALTRNGNGWGPRSATPSSRSQHHRLTPVMPLGALTVAVVSLLVLRGGRCGSRRGCRRWRLVVTKVAWWRTPWWHPPGGRPAWGAPSP